jgi:hypothetical protein
MLDLSTNAVFVLIGYEAAVLGKHCAFVGKAVVGE